MKNVTSIHKQSRRDFSKRIAALALPQAIPREKHMFLALNNELLAGRVGWPAFAELAGKVGYPGVDIMLDPAMKAGVESTRQLLASNKLRPAAINFPLEFRKDNATYQAGLTKLPDQAKFAKEIGCPRMVTYILPSGDTPKDELRKLYLHRFAESARILANYDVRLGLEFLGPLQFRKGKYLFIWQMNEMLAFAEECGPNVGLLLDAWHWHHAGATTNDIIKAGRPKIVHVHFDDAPDLPPEQIRDNQRLLPGKGVIDLTGFLKALQQIGYSDALSVEVFGCCDAMSPENAAKAGLDASLATFKKAGVKTDPEA